MNDITDRFFTFIAGILTVLLVVFLVYLLVGLMTHIKWDMTDFDRRNAIVIDCLKSEAYTRDECIRLAEGK